MPFLMSLTPGRRDSPDGSSVTCAVKFRRSPRFFAREVEREVVVVLGDRPLERFDALDRPAAATARSPMGDDQAAAVRQRRRHRAHDEAVELIPDRAEQAVEPEEDAAEPAEPRAGPMLPSADCPSG